MLVQETTGITRSPRRRPTHLPHNPFEVMSFTLPVHGGCRDLSAERRDPRHQILSRLVEVPQLGFRQNGFVRILVHEATFVVRGLTERRVEKSPSSSIAVVRSVQVTCAIPEQVLHCVLGGEVGTQAWLVQICDTQWKKQVEML